MKSEILIPALLGLIVGMLAGLNGYDVLSDWQPLVVLVLVLVVYYGLTLKRKE